MATSPRSPREIDEHESLTPTQWKQFWAAWLGYLLDGFDFLLITLVLTELADEFGLSLVEATTLVSAAFVSRWFGGLLLGAVADRFGRKGAMVISILCFAGGSFLCGLAWGYWPMFIFRAIVGIGMAGEYATSVTYAMESWPQRFRNRASGALLSAYPIGVVLASQLYPLVVPSLGWRWMFFIGLLPAAVALWMRRVLPEAKEWEDNVKRGVIGENTPIQLLFNPQRRLANIAISTVTAAILVVIFSRTVTGTWVWVLGVLVAGCFLALARQIAAGMTAMYVMLIITVLTAFLYSWPLQSLLPTYLKTELHFDPAQVAHVLLWAGLGYAAGSVTSGIVGDKLGTRRTYVLGLLISLLFVVPVFALTSDHVVWLWVLLFGLAFFSQGISGLLPKFVSDHLPVNLRAGGLGFCYNVGALGGAIAPIMGASIASTLGLGTTLTVLTLGFTVLVAILVGFDVPNLVGRSASDPGVTDEMGRFAMTADDGSLGGLIPPLTTPLTPNGEVDESSLERLCAFLITAGVDGLFVGGSSGEAALLSDSQRYLAIEVAANVAAGQVPVVAGAIDTGTARVIDHARAAAKRGAAAVVSTGPFYVAPHPDEVVRHFHLLRDAVDVPVIAYDIPSATHAPLPRAAVEQLATDGTIAGLKDSSGDLTAFRQILASTAATGLRVFTGSETVTDLALQLGAHGQVPGLGNVDPDGYVRLGRAAGAGDWVAAAAEQERLLRVFAIVDVADRTRIGFTAGALGAFKAAQYLRGVIATPRCADPLLPLTTAEIEAIRAILVAEGIPVER